LPISEAPKVGLSNRGGPEYIGFNPKLILRPPYFIQLLSYWAAEIYLEVIGVKIYNL
jgi:hypothetical protein